MRYTNKDDEIEIFGKDDFCPEHILECGQIFSYKRCENCWEVFSKDCKATIFENANGFIIKTAQVEYFENFFDLKTDYSDLKNRLSKFEIMKEPIKFGSGIRILRQSLFETLISFIVSANNNIKRIQMILWRLREKFGNKVEDYFSFPTREQMLKATEEDFVQLGAGYRAKYLYNVLRQVDEDMLQDWQTLPTIELRNKLISLSGVGPKVADCVLLFGFGRGDVFPVDTWIEKMYFKFYGKQYDENNVDKLPTYSLTREKIRDLLTQEFGLLSGYAQQYLFFFMRSGS